MRVRRDVLGNRLSLEQDAASGQAAREEPEAGIEPAVTVPIGNPGRPVGHVQIGSAPGVLHEVRRGLRDTFVAAGVVTTVLAALIGLVVGRRMTAPISSLTASARRMGDGDLGARAPERGKGEMRELAVASTPWLPGWARPSRSCGGSATCCAASWATPRTSCARR